MQTSKESHRILEQDFKQLFLNDVGNISFKQAQYEQIELPKLPNENHQQFYLDEGEVQVQPSIKTMQFNGAIIMPTDYPKPINQMPSVSIKNVLAQIGCNNGRNTFLLINGKICKCIGNALIYNKQMYLSHSYPICILFYDRESQQLYSGSKGKCPQICIWKVNQNGVDFMNKVHQPRRSLGVSFVQRISQDKVISIDQFNLHKSSSLYVYDLSTSKKVTSSKLGKVLDFAIINQKQYLILNQEGIFKIEDQNGQFDISEAYKNQNLSSFCLFQTKQLKLMIGTREGQVIFLHGFDESTMFKHNLHQGWVYSIKCIHAYKFISAGGMDNKIAIFTIDNNKITVIQQFSFFSYCKSLSIQDDSILLGFRNGSFNILAPDPFTPQKYTLKYEKKIQQQYRTYRNFFQISQKLSYNKYSKRFQYISNETPSILNISMSKTNQLSTQANFLKEKPIISDICGNFIAYLTNHSQKAIPFRSTFKKSTFFSSSLKLQESSTDKYELIIEDYIENKVCGRIEIAQKYSYIKYNGNGDKIAVGMANGCISLLDTKTLEIVCSTSQADRHSTAIQQLIWSVDGNHLLSIAGGQLFYFQVSFNKAYSLSKIKNRLARDIKWMQIAKFGCESKYMWDQFGSIDQVSAVRSSDQYIFVCMQSGVLRIYNKPAAKGKFKEFKLFSHPFDVLPHQTPEGQLLIIYSNGKIAFSKVELAQPQVQPQGGQFQIAD